MKKKLLKWTSKRSGIYIIPNRWGAGFLAIIMIFFYLAVSINSNTLLMMTFWPFAMFFVMLILGHFNVANFDLEKLKIMDQFSGKTLEAFVVVHGKFGGQQVHLEVGQDLYFQSIKEINLPMIEGRGRVEQQRVMVWSNFPFGLFYVWRYYPIAIDYYKFPTYLSQLEHHQPFSFHFEDDGVEEFQGPKNFEENEGGKRLIWKSVASGQSWKSKHFQDEKNKGIKIDWSDITGEHEEKLKILGTLVTMAFRQNVMWSLKTPHYFAEMGEGEEHWLTCMRALSEHP